MPEASVCFFFYLFLAQLLQPSCRPVLRLAQIMLL